MEYWLGPNQYPEPYPNTNQCPNLYPSKALPQYCARTIITLKFIFEFEGKRKDTSLVITRSFQYFCEHRRQL